MRQAKRHGDALAHAQRRARGLFHAPQTRRAAAQKGVAHGGRDGATRARGNFQHLAVGRQPRDLADAVRLWHFFRLHIHPVNVVFVVGLALALALAAFHVIHEEPVAHDDIGGGLLPQQLVQPRANGAVVARLRVPVPHGDHFGAIHAHLRGGLADGLRRNNAHHFAGIDQPAQKHLVALVQHLRQGLAAQLEGRHDHFGVQIDAHERLENKQRVSAAVAGHGRRRLCHHHIFHLANLRLDHAVGGVGRQLHKARRGPGPGPGPVFGLDIFDHALQVDGRTEALLKHADFASKLFFALHQHGVFFFQRGLHRGQGLALIHGERLVRHEVRLPVQALELMHKTVVKLGGRNGVKVKRVLGNALQAARVIAVFAVLKLDNVAHGVAHRVVRRHAHVFHGLDEPPLDVARFRRLDGRVNDADAARHGVKDVLLRRNAREKTVGNKAARRGAVVVARVKRQRAPVHVQGRAFPLDLRLPQTPTDLRNVEHVALGLGFDYVGQTIGCFVV